MQTIQADQSQAQPFVASLPLTDHLFHSALFNLRAILKAFTAVANNHMARDTALNIARDHAANLHDLVSRLERLTENALAYDLGNTTFTVELLIEDMVDARTESEFVDARNHLTAACIAMAADVILHLSE